MVNYAVLHCCQLHLLPTCKQWTLAFCLIAIC